MVSVRLWPDGNVSLFRAWSEHLGPVEPQLLDSWHNFHDAGLVAGRHHKVPGGVEIELLREAAFGKPEGIRESWDFVNDELIERDGLKTRFDALHFVESAEAGPPPHAYLCGERTTPFFSSPFPFHWTWCSDTKARYHGHYATWRYLKDDSLNEQPPVTTMKTGEHGDWILEAVDIYEHGRLVWTSDGKESCVCWTLEDLERCKQTCPGAKIEEEVTQPPRSLVEVRLGIRELTRESPDAAP